MKIFLARKGIRLSKTTVHRHMNQELGLHAVTMRKKRAHAQGEKHKTFPNLLKQNFTVTQRIKYGARILPISGYSMEKRSTTARSSIYTIAPRWRRWIPAISTQNLPSRRSKEPWTMKIRVPAWSRVVTRATSSRHGSLWIFANPKGSSRAWAKQDALMTTPLWNGFTKHLRRNWYTGIVLWARMNWMTQWHGMCLFGTTMSGHIRTTTGWHLLKHGTDDAFFEQPVTKMLDHYKAVSVTSGCQIHPDAGPGTDKPLIKFLRKECRCFFKKRFSFFISSNSPQRRRFSFIISSSVGSPVWYWLAFGILCWIRYTIWKCWISQLHIPPWYFCGFGLLPDGDERFSFEIRVHSVVPFWLLFSIVLCSFFSVPFVTTLL